MMSPTLYDAVAIIGLAIDGDEIPFLHDVLGNDLGFQVNKKNNAYSNFINTFNRGSGVVGEIKHKAFLLFWICQFFICTSPIAVVVKFTPYVNMILNRTYLNTSALFLSLLYKGLFIMVSQLQKDESVKFVFGSFWFL